ncbi:MAG TPA: glycosyltransferase family 2 protein, partial [Gammaproteobacteria bacterium]|nr:glycosyltransferase family 2 protein [Gammaproteobacteria bacterium]
VRDPQDVLHVPQILYHWRAVEGSTAAGHDNKDYATDAARRALQEYFDACHPGVEVSISGPGLYRHRWPLPNPAPLVSLIVPTRDSYDILKTCIESILSRTTYPHYEILLVDNQSTCPQTLAYMAQLADDPRVQVLRYDQPFNYSAINNFAAREAQGTLIGLINNDVEVLNADWLGEMVRHAVRSEIGCVGAKLYYPDGTLQHCGVVLGIGGVAGHSHKYFPGDTPGYFSRLRIVHNVSAVTGAALVLRKEVFDAVGGLDEQGLAVAFNDVDLCLKVMAAGFRNLWTPFAELIHHESKSRGLDQTPEKQARFRAECEVMQQRWGELLRKDPCSNPNLTLLREDYSLSTSAPA